MSVEQIEEQIRQLTASDLSQFTRWFGQYLADRVSSPELDWQESADQIAELDRRLAEFNADPALATPSSNP
jgi:ribosomal protein L16 Arg81 hydroxylase